MKKLLVGFVLLGATILSAQPVFAHVLVTDDTKTKGAILHITPDDDPVAGQEATLYFDTQNNVLRSDSSVQLTVLDVDGQSNKVTTKKDGSLVTASYAFPTQGVYELTFTVNTDGTAYVFRQSQRVSRGVASSALDTPNYEWAKILLLGSSIGFALLLTTAYNRRKEIAAQSTF